MDDDHGSFVGDGGEDGDGDVRDGASAKVEEDDDESGDGGAAGMEKDDQDAESVLELLLPHILDLRAFRARGGGGGGAARTGAGVRLRLVSAARGFPDRGG